MSSRSRDRRRQPVEPDEPVVVDHEGLRQFLDEMDRRGRPEFRYQVADQIRADRDLDQAEILARFLGEEPTEDPDGAESAEGTGEGSEVKGEGDGTEGEGSDGAESVDELPELPEIPEDAKRDDLIAYAAEHLDLDLPGNISRDDALEAITARIEEMTAEIEGNEG